MPTEKDKRDKRHDDFHKVLLDLEKRVKKGELTGKDPFPQDHKLKPGEKADDEYGLD
jgi:hypothetical protein